MSLLKLMLWAMPLRWMFISFLTLKMEDSKKLIEHIQRKLRLAVELLSIHSESYETLKNGFLAMIKSDD